MCPKIGWKKYLKNILTIFKTYDKSVKNNDFKEKIMYNNKLISGKKCYLSPMEPTDEGKYTEWLGDEELSMYLNLHNSIFVNFNEKDSLKYLFSYSGFNYAVIDMETKKIIGNCGFKNIKDDQSTEAGIFIGDTNFYDNGYGYEALCLLLDYGFKTLNIQQILIKVYGHNTRAIECYEEIGFKEERDERETVTIKNEKYYILYYCIRPKEFYKKYKVNK
jgi:RimJ/RimL family protein N-acetyltransferase